MMLEHPAQRPEPVVPAVPRTARRRRRLWELDPRLHCSIIGTCLTLEDLRRICRRAAISVERPMTDYELHHAFVHVAASPVTVARLANKTLDRKHRQAIDRYARAKSPAELQALWDEALESGQVPGAYWALLTHPLVNDALVDRAAGEVHMLSHLAGASRRADLRRLDALERRSSELQQQLAQAKDAARRRLEDKNKTIAELRRQLRAMRDLKAALAEAQARLARLEGGGAWMELRAEAERYAGELAAARRREAEARAALERWQRRAERQAQRLRGLRQALHASRRDERRPGRDLAEGARLAPLCGRDCPEADPGCPGVDLCGRCILYVGGRPNLTPHLSDLVRRCNGRLLQHDGGREDPPARLAALLPQADVVVCPLDCVSHDAVRRVKGYCRQHAKRLLLLPSASLSTFARGLQELAPAAAAGA